ncbi:MAG: hypothetical protein M1817_003268 [Caeruleum heppii]|nr:MAG: hypothetical protein M1817_003268 [Caeruleum heppii]
MSGALGHWKYAALTDTPPPRRRALHLLVRFIELLVFAALGAGLVYYFLHTRHTPLPVSKVTVPPLPHSFRTVGLVFYGRRDRVSILDCYLKKNLVENGGVLDEVVFVARSSDVEDLRWLDDIVTTSDSYSRVNLTSDGTDASTIDYGKIWDIPQKGVMYIKIDDDVVFIDDDAIPQIIRTKVAHPEYLTVSVNAINNPALSWVHYHLGVIRPYLPELTLHPPSSSSSSSSSDLSSSSNATETPSPTWRASKLPFWSGPDSFTLPTNYQPPFKGHRWLPLGPSYNLDGTPITQTTYEPKGPGWNNWLVVAQEHYSFLEHLEAGSLARYKFPLWDYQYERLSINLIAIWGDDIVQNRPFPEDDERFLTVDLPKRLGRHSIVDGNAISAHYSFRHQIRHGRGLDWTDVLDRYRAYAEEMVCRR